MISSLGFTTRGRPESLLRCVQSYIENAREHGRHPRVLIMDDFVPGVQDSSRPVAEKLRRDNRDFEIWYAGHTEKRRFIRQLVSLGLREDVLEYGLLDPETSHYTLGANRNALQLATLGEHVLYIDDDSLARLARPPEWAERLVVAGPGSTQEYWFYEDREAALRAACFAPASLLDLHEKYLGRACHDIMEEAGDAEAGETDFWPRFMREKATVRITQNGVVGDSCMFSCIGHMLHGRPATQNRLRSSARMLETALNSREIIRSPSNPTLRLGGLLIGPDYGCDQTALLPPYLPVFRSSDSTFSSTLSVIDPAAAFADIPWLVVHDAEPGRTYHYRGCFEPWHCSVGEVVRGLLYVVSACGYHSFANPLGSRGEKLVEMGLLPAEEFLRLIQGFMDEMIDLKIQRLSRLRTLAGEASSHYTQALDRSIGLLRESLRDALRLVPVEVRPGRTPAEALDQTQRLVRRFGELMQLWPDADSATRALAAKGVQLAVPV